MHISYFRTQEQFVFLELMCLCFSPCFLSATVFWVQLFLEKVIAVIKTCCCHSPNYPGRCRGAAWQRDPGWRLFEDVQGLKHNYLCLVPYSFFVIFLLPFYSLLLTVFLINWMRWAPAGQDCLSVGSVSGWAWSPVMPWPCLRRTGRVSLKHHSRRSPHSMQNRRMRDVVTGVTWPIYI